MYYSLGTQRHMLEDLALEEGLEREEEWGKEREQKLQCTKWLQLMNSWFQSLLLYTSLLLEDRLVLSKWTGEELSS